MRPDTVSESTCINCGHPHKWHSIMQKHCNEVDCRCPGYDGVVLVPAGGAK